MNNNSQKVKLKLFLLSRNFVPQFCDTVEYPDILYNINYNYINDLLYPSCLMYTLGLIVGGARINSF